MVNPESNFENSWADQARAESYSRLEFPNTYYLAYRDLPDIISRHVTGNRAVDFGCGTGRSSRFLKRLGFDIMLDVEDKRPVEDIFWSLSDYEKLFNLAGLVIEATYKPVGYDNEPFEWISEKEIAPWMIFVLKKIENGKN